MNRRVSQFSLTFLMILIACIALNLWLFKQGILWGIIGLNISKHVVIAYLCRNLGVNRTIDPGLGDPFADPE
jgi:multisubunit Na+/H+ antiporter MnhC subunit